MRFLKYFKQIFESITNLISDNKNWVVKYNHMNTHDLDKKMTRTSLDESTFNINLQKIISIADSEQLSGDWVFTSFKYSCKIITNINYKDKFILIVTVLGKDEYVKETKKIKLI